MKLQENPSDSKARIVENIEISQNSTAAIKIVWRQTEPGVAMFLIKGLIKINRSQTREAGIFSGRLIMSYS